MAVDAPLVAGEGVAAAALKEADAVAAAASPSSPGGNVRRTLAVDEPGVTSTTTLVALGFCTSIAACTVATSAVVSGLANVI
jgi:hypothetical protein